MRKKITKSELNLLRDEIKQMILAYTDLNQDEKDRRTKMVIFHKIKKLKNILDRLPSITWRKDKIVR